MTLTVFSERSRSISVEINEAELLGFLCSNFSHSIRSLKAQSFGIASLIELVPESYHGYLGQTSNLIDP